MAKKPTPPPAKPLPSLSSSEEEGEDSSSSSDEEQTNVTKPYSPAKSVPSSSSSEEEGEESSSDEEQTNATKPDPPPAKSLPSSSSSEEEGEESSSDEEQTNITKPDPQTTIAKKSKSKESSYEEEEVEDEDQNPRSVNKTLSEPESEKILTQSKPIPEKPKGKPPFTRLWSFDDEIVILKALVDYQSKHDLLKFSVTGLKDFHEYVKKSLSVDVGTAKLSDKIRRLRSKYTHANKKDENVKFLNLHSKTVYELSKKVWPKEKELDDDVGFEVEALNGDSSGMTVNRIKRLKTEFPFIKDALAGHRLALQKLHKVDAEKVSELEMKFEKNKHEELYLICEAYEMVCNEAQKVMN